MIGVALKGLMGRKVRALLTAFAVVIGVAMVSGTFVLTDTIQKAFDGIFTASYEQTDAVIAGKEIVKGSQSGAATIPESLLAEGAGAARGRSRRRHDRADRDPTRPRSSAATARRIGSGGATHLRARQRRVAAAVQPAEAQDRPVAGRAASRSPSTPARPPTQNFKVGDSVTVSTLGAKTATR